MHSKRDEKRGREHREAKAIYMISDAEPIMTWLTTLPIERTDIRFDVVTWIFGLFSTFTSLTFGLHEKLKMKYPLEDGF